MDNPLEPKPPVGITRGLIRHRDIDDEFEDPATTRTCSGLSPVN